MAKEGHCYCGGRKTPFMFLCSKCNQLFHAECLKKGSPSSLVGDTLFHFVCSKCNDNGCESSIRMKLHWMQVVLLTLYNLHLQGGGKCGYYRWRENICTFIEKHWTTFFGLTRKKTSTWHGTVAGTLSTGSPQYFQSGQTEFNESGWWALADPNSLESLNLELLTSQDRCKKGKSTAKATLDSPNKSAALRHSITKSSLQAAMELKERRRSCVIKKELGHPSKALQNTAETAASQNPLECGWMTDCAGSSRSSLEWSACDDSTESWFTERDLKPEETLPQFLLKGDETVEMDELEIDPCLASPVPLPNSPKVEELMNMFGDEVKSSSSRRALAFDESHHATDISTFMNNEKPVTGINDQNSTDLSETTNQSLESEDAGPSRKRQRSETKDVEDPAQETTIRHLPLSIYEEHALLERLQQCRYATEHCPEARLLRRKLLVRRTKRERNLPVFDLDREVFILKGMTFEQDKNQSKFADYQEHRVLDRYQTELQAYHVRDGHRSSFLTRLVGRDENQLDNIISPYTARVLKPFIWRDYETVPPKLKLLQEIVAYHHRHDPNWKPGPRHPIDYCYVQPKHIPSVNAFCQEFFWPGIDLSECLQYPDFSCVVMYKKMVIGFSFMVPDVKCNEAYITFVFTHPEWRNAGIATFMIYHLIQTCMGKDVTLHVSATNSAIFLYQKFGFKMEEFVLDFYDKYYPEGSTECKHSFFLRLSH